METVYLMLGSNLGDRMLNLQQAISMISVRAGSIKNMSAVYETAPWNAREDLPFLNIAMQIETKQSPLNLLDTLLKIETEMGRIRDDRLNAPRPVDIDILLYGNYLVDIQWLTIPHPRMHLRRFVLEPMNEIAPDALHPGLNMRIEDLLKQCDDMLAVNFFSELKNPSI